MQQIEDWLKKLGMAELSRQRSGARTSTPSAPSIQLYLNVGK